MNAIHVACTTDVNYIQHVGVMLCSLFENNKQNKFVIYLIIDFEQNKDILRLLKLIKKYGHKLNIIQTDGKLVEELTLSAHATKAVYYRLLIPSLIDLTITKILYLDCDIIVNCDIGELWNINIDDYSIAAVAEPLFDRHQQLQLPNSSSYFNSGVMLINLDYWRKFKISERVIQFIDSNPEKIMYWDQDGLNVVLQNSWKEVSLKWNLQSQFFDKTVTIDKVHIDCIETCKKEPAIIHYSSKFKPWHYWCDHPMKEEYYRYLRLTPWKNFRLPEYTRWQQLKQQVKKVMNKITGRKLFEVYA